MQNPFAPGPSRPMGPGPGPSAPQGVKFKVVMCKNMTEQGNCPRGTLCSFAHSKSELLKSRQADPRYKTTLCENFKNSSNCPKGQQCSFAHGANELRSRSNTAAPASFFGSGGGFGGGEGYCEPDEQYMQQGGFDPFAYDENYGPQNNAPADPRFKTVLCSPFTSNGFCPKNNNCTFAHGVDELSNADKYKTAMCKNVDSAGSCPKGVICFFAHSEDELRARGATAQKRKQTNTKTMLCQNFATFGNCEYQNCAFAHGEDELQINKRLRV